MLGATTHTRMRIIAVSELCHSQHGVRELGGEPGVATTRQNLLESAYATAGSFSREAGPGKALPHTSFLKSPAKAVE